MDDFQVGKRWKGEEGRDGNLYNGVQASDYIVKEHIFDL